VYSSRPAIHAADGALLGLASWGADDVLEFCEVMFSLRLRLELCVETGI